MSEVAHDDPQALVDPSNLKTDAVSIVEDLTERFETLRHWHHQIQSRLDQRSAALDQREARLNETQQRQKTDASKLARRREAQRRYRTKLENQARQLDQRKQSLDAGQDQLDAREGQLNAGCEELARLREELDAEWANLTRLRRSQEALAAALETDRKRVNQQRFRLGPDSQIDLQSDRFKSHAQPHSALAETDAEVSHRASASPSLEKQAA